MIVIAREPDSYRQTEANPIFKSIIGIACLFGKQAFPDPVGFLVMPVISNRLFQHPGTFRVKGEEVVGYRNIGGEFCNGVFVLIAAFIKHGPALNAAIFL